MSTVFLFALTSMLNPTLLAASTLMMLLANPVKLMLGYLLGAMMTSITLGLVIVFSLNSSSTVSSTKKTISPAVDIALGALLLVLAFVLATGRASRARERRRERKESKSKGPKEPPRWQRALSKGTARTTFIIGALLTLPGASYLAGLDQIHKLNYGNAETVLLVIAFNIVMLALLEVPLVCFAVAPDWTPGAIARAKAWIGRRGAELAARGFAVIGVLLVVKGVVGLIAAS
jgi:Sap, sulfolipid-1-addressing protein